MGHTYMFNPFLRTINKLLFVIEYFCMLNNKLRLSVHVYLNCSLWRHRVAGGRHYRFLHMCSKLYVSGAFVSYYNTQCNEEQLREPLHRRAREEAREAASRCRHKPG